MLGRQEIDGGYAVTVQAVKTGPTTHVVQHTSQGNQVITTTPDGRSSTSLDDFQGDSTLQSPDGTATVTTYQPDSRFGLLAPVGANQTVTTPSGLVSTVQDTRDVTLADPLNPAGALQLIHTKTVNGNAWVVDYEADGGTVTTTSPVGRQVIKTLDALGRVVQVARPGVDPVRFTYDPQGRVTAVQQGARSSLLTYGDGGFAASMTDALGETVQFSQRHSRRHSNGRSAPRPTRYSDLSPTNWSDLSRKSKLKLVSEP